MACLNSRSRGRKDWKIYIYLNDVIYIIDKVDSKDDLKVMSLRFVIVNKV